MNRFPAAVLAVLALLSSPQALAVIPVQLTSSFQNENWFPLSEKDMREAAIDTALADISEQGLVEFTDSAKAAGQLELRVTLVEPASVVKLTITFQMEGIPSAVATASTSLDGLDHQGIFYAFEHVGHEAAGRMHVKLTAAARLHRQLAALEPRPAKPVARLPAGSAPATPASNASDCAADPLARLTSGPVDGWSARAIYQTGQTLKEEGCYFDAKVAFELVGNDSREANASWRSLAAEELRFGLPIYEARQLSLDISRLLRDERSDAARLTAHLNRIEQLYRQVLVENETSVSQVLEVQRELDNFHHTRRAIGEVLKANTLGEAGMLRVQLTEQVMNSGVMPADADDLKRELGPALRNFEVVTVIADTVRHSSSVTLRHRRWGTTLVVNLDLERGATLKMVE